MTFIKICGLRDADTVDLAVRLGVDAIGFVFAESVRKVDTELAADLIARVPDTIRAVGVFLGNPLEQILEIAKSTRLKYVQVHDLEAPEQVKQLHDAGLTVIRAVVSGRVRDGYSLDLGEDELLIDGADAGSGVAWDWAQQQSRPAGQWILAGGLGPDNVRAALDATGAWGVDVSSGVESSRGVKDHALIERFVAAARA
ncbi:phosphoribosylanthranilate isomerase [Rhodococcus sp. MS16]|uniref:N-(5'-phosphoribosyl)anthranilate isomerase n=1 Tax=Nocardia globerula TaxID=1818 RepID=A0A652YL37_NOCGL|nr:MULTISPECIES: phosphoribosylanthranilate isomerase [Rhodococcus]NMD60204.1 phosphoribosylanthranilate isomerase [Nocardia globerula]NRI67303.1 phosphoribosylanthranilate isomerase [Rhodococcus sp. MS16]PVX63682.1 phosphoribosylanthranilate isomerase [Rhodococcus globerulus]RZL26150.1 MAG: phosphoribosylanthranilate isomerase [Rhodococcus sp. (in: high G+C Gram-positive bacteria)]